MMGLWTLQPSMSNLRSLLLHRCDPILVSNCLYWLDTQMWAYDLTAKQYFEGPIEDCHLQNHLVNLGNLEMTKRSYFSYLFSIYLETFSLTWVNASGIHSTTLQVLRTSIALKENHFKLSAKAFSCQTFISGPSPFLQDREVILVFV